MLEHQANPLARIRLKDGDIVVEPEAEAGKAIVPAGTWSADPAHSSVEFKVIHDGAGRVNHGSGAAGGRAPG
jgi:polyisoprenoid-binding protein YceI